MEYYLVGGAVRDELLGIEVKDKDYVVVGATPSQMLAQGFRQVGKDFPVFLHPKTHEEYALARAERKIGKGYNGFSFDFNPNISLEDDLKRRDLTINAIAKDAAGNFIDPYDGISDLKNRYLRHVSDSFVEDPLRVLRCARFAAKLHHFGFHLHKDTTNLMKEIVASKELEHLVSERIWQEITQSLTTKSPWIFWQILHSIGALKKILPELDALWGMTQSISSHPEIDVGVHTMMVLVACCQLTTDPTIRFAALCHDLGKGLGLPNHKYHEVKGADLVKNLCKRLRVSKDYRDIAVLTARYHGMVHNYNQLTKEQRLNLLQSLDVYRKPYRLNALVTACIADSLGRLGFTNCDYPQGELIAIDYRKTNNINIKQFLDKGLEGEEIKQALYTARLDSLT